MDSAKAIISAVGSRTPRAQAMNGPRTVCLVDHQQRASGVVVGAAALRGQSATFAVRVQRLGYVDHD
jgi:hypothetical protein